MEAGMGAVRLILSTSYLCHLVDYGYAELWHRFSYADDCVTDIDWQDFYFSKFVHLCRDLNWPKFSLYSALVVLLTYKF